MRALIRCLAFLVIVVPPVAAQDLTAGVSVGVVKLSDTRSEQALSGVLAYQAGWLSLYAVPAILHLSSTATRSTVSSSGLGDLPLIAAASYTSPAPASPSVGASLAVVLPTGNASCGLGSGQAAAGVDVGTADSTHPLSRVIGLGVSHPLAGPLLLTVDGGHGLTTGSPQWVLMVGLGTAFAGSSPVTPTTPLRRIATTFRTGTGSRTASCP